MSLGNDQRIRQVAIVLQSMDATTARALLAQFPAEAAKTVRRALTRLGTVTNEERDAAFRDLDQLRKTTLNVTEEESSVLLAEPSRSKQFRFADTPIETESDLPWSAGEATTALPIDRAFASAPWHSRPAPSRTPLHSELVHPQTPSADGAWNDVGSVALAAALQQERPLVIAAVLNHLPLPLASETLQHIPTQLATQALALLPNLHRSDPEALLAIHQEIKAKILQGTSLRTTNNGHERLQAILASLPPEEQPAWTEQLKAAIPDWSAATDDRNVPLPRPLESPEHSPATNPPSPAQSATSHSHRIRKPASTNPLKSLAPDVASHDVAAGAFTVLFPSPSRNDGDSSASPAAIAPSPTDLDNSAQSKSELPHPNVLFMIDAESQRSMDEILHFSDADIVRILQSNDPQTVLLSMCHASLPVRQRMERLLPSKDIQRFRSRIQTLEATMAIHSEEAMAARKNILDRADSMLAIGEIALRPQSKHRRSA